MEEPIVFCNIPLNQVHAWRLLVFEILNPQIIFTDDHQQNREKAIKVMQSNAETLNLELEDVLNIK